MKIIAEPERLDARVPLGMVAVTLLTLLLSAGLTLGVRALAEGELHRAALTSGPRPVTPESLPPAQPNALFGRHRPPGATRQLPPSSGEYGWVDRQQGLVRIPLERAKQLYLAPPAGPTHPASQTEGSRR